MEDQPGSPAGRMRDSGGALGSCWSRHESGKQASKQVGAGSCRHRGRSRISVVVIAVINTRRRRMINGRDVMKAEAIGGGPPVGPDWQEMTGMKSSTWATDDKAKHRWEIDIKSKLMKMKDEVKVH